MEETEELQEESQEMREILFRVINDQSTNDDTKKYPQLRIALISGLEATEIPDFLFTCESLVQFNIFINAYSVSKSNKVSFIKNTFEPLIGSNKKVAQLSGIVNTTITEARHVGRVADGTNSGTNKIIKYSWGFLSVVAVFATLYGFYLQLRTNNPRLFVNNSLISHLTIPPRIAGLRASYYYRDSAVSDLWKLNANVGNNGNETIIGVGTKKNILQTAGLILKVRNGFKVLNLETINETFPAKIQVLNDTSLSISFEQWRKGEAIQVSLYLEKVSREGSAAPALYLDERQIVDGKVDIIPYQAVLQVSKPYVIDALPVAIRSPLRWGLIIVFGVFALIGMPAAAYSELKSKGNSSKLKTIMPFIILALLFVAPLLWLVPKFW